MQGRFRVCEVSVYRRAQQRGRAPLCAGGLSFPGHVRHLCRFHAGGDSGQDADPLLRGLSGRMGQPRGRAGHDARSGDDACVDHRARGERSGGFLQGFRRLP